MYSSRFVDFIISVLLVLNTMIALMLACALALGLWMWIKEVIECAAN